MPTSPERQANNHPPKNLELALVAGSISLSLLGFLVFDGIYSSQQRSNPFSPPPLKTNGRKLYISKSNGWYELNKNYDGEDRYGRYRIDVKTDENGFRIPTKQQPTLTDKRSSAQAPALVFLGDSFTYGVGTSWDNTFVGQVAKHYPGPVINAGVVSHSPTAHRYRLERLLKSGTIPDGAVVIMAVDISDVQDESSRWIPQTSGPPQERNSAASAAVVERQGTATKQIRKSDEPWFSPRRFQLTHRLYYGLEVLYKQFFDHWQIRNNARSAFTHRPWNEIDEAYKPLGVVGGLGQLRRQITAAAKLSTNYGHQFFLLIYPWPAQLAYSDQFNWESWISQSCHVPDCSGVINAFPAMRQQVTPNRNAASWQERLYLKGDMHLSPAGNAVVAQTILKALQE
ncbi:MAG: hypothetical protein VKM98_09115 [Cyanobacteriota bacterium]|nr:hypothetical protein [Cyanobacteriota bacterium]